MTVTSHHSCRLYPRLQDQASFFGTTLFSVGSDMVSGLPSRIRRRRSDVTVMDRADIIEIDGRLSSRDRLARGTACSSQVDHSKGSNLKFVEIHGTCLLARAVENLKGPEVVCLVRRRKHKTAAQPEAHLTMSCPSRTKLERKVKRRRDEAEGVFRVHVWSFPTRRVRSMKAHPNQSESCSAPSSSSKVSTLVLLRLVPHPLCLFRCIHLLVHISL